MKKKKKKKRITNKTHLKSSHDFDAQRKSMHKVRECELQ